MTSSSSHVTSQAPAPPDDDDFADFQTASFKVAGEKQIQMYL